MPSSLRTLDIASRYRTGRDDVVGGFYLPLLSTAQEYCRAVGYFTSTSMALVSRGLDRYVDRGGVIRLIASPRLELDDIADIERGYDVRTVLERATARTLESEDDELLLRGLGQLGRLIAHGQLDLKLAFVSDGKRVGVYHEKMGFFRDSLGDVVAFTGSANETYGGLVANFESVEAYRSWLPGDGERALRIVEDFNELWADATVGLRVMEFPAVCRDQLERLSRSFGDHPLLATDDALAGGKVLSRNDDLASPPGFVAREYQRSAVKAWLEHRGRGILKMATGTGKTKTALLAASQVARVHRRRGEGLVVVVVAPLQHLVDQWAEELDAFGSRSIRVYESSQRWIAEIEDALGAVRLGQRSLAVLVATNASFALDRFQSILRRIDGPLLVIGDEVHNLGSPKYRQLLPENATYRLGLSATPERWFDDTGTDALVDYFGPVVFELGLGRAIDLGALCRYRYHPRLVELDDEEMAGYVELTAKIAALMANEDVDNASPDSPLGALLRRRAGVLGHAVGKLPLLRQDVVDRANAWHQLVYCAEGHPPLAAGNSSEADSQVAQVLRLLGRDLSLAAHSYVAQTPRHERQALLRRFETGNDLRFLVAMRCLDEGVDIPDARVAYLLASSSNPRQFIQRRGRILRVSPGKDHADIFDYLTVPQASGVQQYPEVERRLLTRELLRAAEFGKLSENYPETLARLRPVKDRFGLMDI